MKGTWIVFCALLFSCAAGAKNPQVVLETSLGKIVLELDEAKAPLSVKNFLKYVDDGHYNGTVFHRVIPDFMIQGGGFSADLKQKPTNPPVKNEADNGLKNLRGTVSMARTGVVDSATAQFFINTVDNAMLDHRSKDQGGYGYAVFGKVVEGMDVVDKIRATPTLCPSKVPAPCDKPLPPGMRDVPEPAVVITKASRK
ncbi:MAG: peptidylprolyl isomerase [Deltaproteobacteria bacterium]|nr:peptidylprolyl isomerase [Deltaproteobacteria bacterium]